MEIKLYLNSKDKLSEMPLKKFVLTAVHIFVSLFNYKYDILFYFKVYKINLIPPFLDNTVYVNMF